MQKLKGLQKYRKSHIKSWRQVRIDRYTSQINKYNQKLELAKYLK